MKRLLVALGACPVLTLVALAGAAGTAGDVATYTVQLTGRRRYSGLRRSDGMATAPSSSTVSNEVCVTRSRCPDSRRRRCSTSTRRSVGVAGPIVVDLVPALTSVPYCTTIDPALMAELIPPDGFY